MHCQITVTLLVFFISTAYPQQNYFYKGRDFGSEALYNPFSLLLNGSYDIIQLDGHTRDIFHFNYRTGASNVLRNLSSPFGAIRRYGALAFLENEILPIHFYKNGAQWWPNYQLHLIGGGMTYTAMAEWYQLHHVPAPRIFSIATMAAYHFLNEVVENGEYEGDTVDPIADLYVFDAGGIVLFSFDGVNKFFSETMNLADWSLQPSFSLHDASLQNNGQYFSIKWKFPFSERWHLFYYCGMNGLTGLSYKTADGAAISVGAGLRAKQRVVLNQETNLQTIDMVWNVSVFYDKDNSLLSSLSFSGLTEYTMSLNVYPGLLRFGSFTPGFWFVVNRDRSVLLGITTIWIPGISFGL